MLREMTPLALLLALVAPYGSPDCPSPDAEFANRGFFALCHSAARRVSLWTAYELDPSREAAPITQRPSFRPDSLLASPGARNSDYAASGYSRGHMAPARDFAWSEEALRATSVLSNAAPQHQRMNASAWLRVENAVRRLATRSGRVLVFTGPIFDAGQPGTIGAGRVAVPAYFFKIVLELETGGKIYAVIVPNDASATGSPRLWVVSVDEVERRTGLDFFREIEDPVENALESARNVLPNR